MPPVRPQPEPNSLASPNYVIVKPKNSWTFYAEYATSLYDGNWTPQAETDWDQDTFGAPLKPGLKVIGPDVPSIKARTVPRAAVCHT